MKFGPGPDVAIGQPIDIKPILPDAEAFPIDMLPARLSAAVQAITDIVQVPISLAAQSVIGACALVAQTRINVEVPTRETVPASLFLFTIAASGDRKTTADKLALGPVYEHERELRKRFEPEQQQYTIDKAAYEAAMSKAKRDGGKDRLAVKRNMEACGSPPLPPALPMLLVEDPTIEGMTKLLDEAYPSIGLFSDEGAKMLGGYSMQEERQASSGAALSQLWDGKPIKRVRGTDVTKILDGRRASVHLMVQPGVASKLFGNKALRDQGMLSRMLVTYPKSLKGSRFWKEPAPETWDAVEAYHKRLSGLLRQAFTRMNPETRELEFSSVALQPEAREMWIAFSDMLERQQGPDQALAEVSDLASKMAQHALRLAAVISYFENGEKLVASGISPASMAAGIALGEFYLSEAIRLFNAGSVDEDSENAATLIDFIRKERLPIVGHRWLSRNCPKPVRPAKVLQRAIELLMDQGHLRKIEGGAECTARGKSFSERAAYTVIYPEADK
jgi:hypothetical protein